jgi:hypothetical protein
MSDPNNRRRTRTAAFETPAAAHGARHQRRRVVTTAPRTRSNHQSSNHRNETTRQRTSSRRRQSSRRGTSSRRRNARTVTPATSIRDTARDPTRGSGRYGNERYGINYFQGRRVLFSPGQQQQQEQQQQEQQEEQQAPVERLCYCDQPVDRDCQDCAANRFCTRHPGFYCSGPCGRWIHATCAGYEFNPGPNGALEGGFLQSTFLSKGDEPGPLCVPVTDSSQGTQNPLFCIKCWESRKRELADSAMDEDFDSLSRQDRMLRLGVIPSGTTARTERNNITKRTELLQKYIEEDMLHTIQQNRPRPYPTHRPMDSEVCFCFTNVFLARG